MNRLGQFPAAARALLVLAAFTTTLAACGSDPPPTAAATSTTPSAPPPAPSSATSTTVPTDPSSARPSVASTGVATYTESDHGSTVHVRVGDRFTVALGENSKLVDNWNMQTQTGLSVVSVGWDPTKAPRPPTMHGADATRTWLLQATQAGRHTLEAMCFGKGQYGGVLADFTMTVVARR